MKLSVAIPSYNRPAELAEALQTIAPQCSDCIEIVISEDRSPRRNEIRFVVEDFSARHPLINIRYYENEENLGYDGNLRALVERCLGEYVFFMGDDDRVVDGGLSAVLNAVAHENVGVVLRAWRSYDGSSGEVLESHHYFSGDRFFKNGQATAAAFYRRSVFISGLTVHREAALRLSSDSFDGMLLYQLYLVGYILRKMNGFYVDSVITERRSGGEFFFGNSKSESGSFVPNKLEPEHSVRFISGLFKIALHLDKTDAGFYKAVCKDLGRYSYPMLEVQAMRVGKLSFVRYGFDLANLGLKKEVFFWFYFFGLLALGPRLCGSIISFLIKKIGGTPVLSGSEGQAVL